MQVTTFSCNLPACLESNGLRNKNLTRSEENTMSRLPAIQTELANGKAKQLLVGPHRDRENDGPNEFRNRGSPRCAFKRPQARSSTRVRPSGSGQEGPGQRCRF